MAIMVFQPEPTPDRMQASTTGSGRKYPTVFSILSTVEMRYASPDTAANMAVSTSACGRGALRDRGPASLKSAWPLPRAPRGGERGRSEDQQEATGAEANTCGAHTHYPQVTLRMQCLGGPCGGRCMHGMRVPIKCL